MHGLVRGATRRESQQCLRRLGRQMDGYFEQRVFVGLPNVIQPRFGHAVAQQLVVGNVCEESRLSGRRRVGRRFHCRKARHFDLAQGLADFDELRRTGLGMPLDPPPFRPSVRRVVMADIGEHDARCGPMHDQANVPIDPDGPEVLVPRPIQLVKRETRRRRVQLQVEGGGLGGLLLVAGQPSQTVGKGIGDPELHVTLHTRNTFIASSPRWLMTLTAMRPEAGRGKGREMSLLRVAQASGSISAFSVVLSAL